MVHPQTQNGACQQVHALQTFCVGDLDQQSEGWGLPGWLALGFQVAFADADQLGAGEGGWEEGRTASGLLPATVGRKNLAVSIETETFLRGEGCPQSGVPLAE